MPTIADVAARAGVGVGTVSRVLNDSPQVRPETRRMVREAIEQLGYRPNRAPSEPRSPMGGLVGVLVPHFDEPSSYQRLRGIVKALQPHGLEIVLYNVDAPDRARSRIAELPRHRLDGLLVISLPLDDRDGERLASAPFPTVLIDTGHRSLPSVQTDDVAGGRLATEHLISLGHERIGFIGEPARNPFGFTSALHREHGYEQAMDAAGLTAPPELRRHGPHLRPAMNRLTHELLAIVEPPTAIVATSDVQALGILEAVRSSGRRVPQHLSLIGYDDIDLAVYSRLTTVRQQLEESGLRGAEMLASAIISGTSLTPAVEPLSLELIVRSTTAPPR
jgi:DNA-binding LacI/PurR family transcriptional regulator